MVRAPIFVVGCGRSGTTLLFDLLSQHPQLARTTGYPDGEDHAGWIAHGRCAMAGIGNVHSDAYGSGINGSNYCLHLTDDDATPDIVRAMHEYYWRDVLQEDPSRRVINKQPHLSNKLRYLLRIFPDARVVHIVRDAAPVVASWMAVMDQHPSLVAYWPDEPYPCFWLFPKPTTETGLSRLARHDRFFPGGGQSIWIDYWRSVNGGIDPQMADRRAQLMVVRYEDLVASTDAVLARVSQFCGLDLFRFETTGIEAHTFRRHSSRLSAPLLAEIDERAATVRSQFGYTARVQ